MLDMLAKAFMFASQQFIRKVASPKHVVHDSRSGQNGATLTADLFIYALGLFFLIHWITLHWTQMADVSGGRWPFESVSEGLPLAI